MPYQEVGVHANMTPPTKYPLSPNQELLQLFDQGNESGPFGPHYNIVTAHQITGMIDPGILRAALDVVVERHEALRTEIVRGVDPHQHVHEPSAPHLDIVDLRHLDSSERTREIEDHLFAIEMKARPASSLPLLAASLIRTGERSHVLALIAHHVAADEWAMQVILRDLLGAYAELLGGTLDRTHGSVIQFGEYSTDQHVTASKKSDERSRQVWSRILGDAAVTPIETTYPRSEGRPKSTAWHRFALDRETVAAVDSLAREHRASPFMVLLACYGRFLAARTRTTSPTIMTFSSGRSDVKFHETVGSFFSFLPLRLDLAEASDLDGAIAVARRACLTAYQHERPFGEILRSAPQLLSASASDRGAICAFQVYRPAFPDEGTIGALSYRAHHRTSSHLAGVDIPDGAMWHIDFPHSGDAAAPVRLGYNTNLYSHSAMADLADAFADHLVHELRSPQNPAAQDESTRRIA